MNLQKALFGPSKDEIWKQFSGQISAQFVEGSPWKGGKIIAKCGDWTITLDSYHVSYGYDNVTYTRLRAPFVNQDGLRFSIYKAGFFDSVKHLLGMQDIETGFPEFDDNYVIQGNQEENIKRIFSNPAIRDMITDQPSIFMEIRDDDGYFSETFPNGVDELDLLIEDEIVNLDQLYEVYQLFAETLHTLCHIGSGYENDAALEI